MADEKERPSHSINVDRVHHVTHSDQGVHVFDAEDDTNPLHMTDKQWDEAVAAWAGKGAASKGS